jgi:alpha-tubulin suppressor-like RCC1 family protein
VTVAGVLGASVSLAQASTIAAGERMSCGIRAGGSVACWGAAGLTGNAAGTASPLPTAVDTISNAVDLAGGYDHTCAVLADHTVECWGSNSDGQLGDGTNSDANAPVAVTGLSDAAAVSTGLRQTCAIRTDGTVKCWGEPAMLGGGTGNNITQVVSISAGALGTCAAQFSGMVKCWGNMTQPPAITDATQVGVGYGFACALRTGGTVICWGNNLQGELGLGNTDVTTTYVDIPGLSGATQIAVGWNHACALLTGGTVKCWGANDSGQLGQGGTLDHSSPVTVTGLSGATDLAAGSGHTCARLASGGVECWGSNLYGQVGNGLGYTVASPLTVAGTDGATALSGGPSFYCAVVSGVVKCWGQNNSGQLGDGTFELRPSPVTVSGITTATDVAAGSDAVHSCALLADHSVTCWGEDSRGELGDGQTTNRATPAVVPGLFASHVAAGLHHTCAVTTDATPQVKCWGDRWHDTGRFIVASPTAVAGTDNAVAVAAGEFNDCALLSGGSVVCWGVNDAGELGNGAQPTPSNNAVPVTGITTATAIKEVNDRSTCALLPGPTVECWGDTYGPSPVTVNGTTFPANSATRDQCSLSGGAVKCTGGENGLLGDGFQPSGHYPAQPVPGAVGSLSDIRAWGSPPRVSLSGFSVSPATLTFPGTAVGPTSDPLSVTLSNTTSAIEPTYFSAAVPTPASDFAQTTTTCGGTLAPGGTCTVSYTFHPSVPGARTGTAAIGLAGGTVTVNLAGTGLTGFSVTPSTTTFPSTAVGAASAPMQVTIVNASGTTKTLNLAVTGLGTDFGATNDCGPTLSPGGSCTLSATFHPTAAGTRTASASVSLAGTDNPFTLTGAGTTGGNELPPSNKFTIRSLKSTKTRIVVGLTLPGNGKIRVVAATKINRKKLTFASKTAPVRAGKTSLTLNASSKFRAALKKLRRTKVTVVVTFTPTGGGSATHSKMVTVKGSKKR